jgi:hypothetical protein
MSLLEGHLIHSSDAFEVPMIALFCGAGMAMLFMMSEFTFSFSLIWGLVGVLFNNAWAEEDDPDADHKMVAVVASIVIAGLLLVACALRVVGARAVCTMCCWRPTRRHRGCCIKTQMAWSLRCATFLLRHAVGVRAVCSGCQGCVQWVSGLCAVGVRIVRMRCSAGRSVDGPLP